MLSSVGRSVHDDEASILEDAIHYGLSRASQALPIVPINRWPAWGGGFGSSQIVGPLLCLVFKIDAVSVDSGVDGVGLGFHLMGERMEALRSKAGTEFDVS